MTTPQPPDTKGTEALIINRVKNMQHHRGTTDSRLMAAAGIRTHNTWRARMDGKHPFTTRELIAITETLGYSFADLTDPHFEIQHPMAAAA